MARSIHSNWREYREEYFGQRRPEELARIQSDLERKRRMKRRVRDSRRRPSDTPPASAETIRIDVCDAGPFVHHPAGPDDLRAVMRRLPPGILNGLAGITLCLGAEHQRELADAEEDDDPIHGPDPYVGRLGWEFPLPGVFTGLLEGHYASWNNDIQVFAYVFDPEMPDRSIFEVYLRLRQLAVFLHELAHHNYWMNHDPRARWTQEDHDRCEDQTEQLAARWVADHAIPYLEDTYPSELATFRAWIVKHGGTNVPLLWLSSSWLPSPNGPRPAAFGTAGQAIYYLVESVRNGTGATASWLQFARDLHYGEFYAESLRIIDRISDTAPEYDEAIVLQADIYVHQRKYEDAERLVREVLERRPDSRPAWELLADILLHGRRWKELWEASVEAIRIFRQTDTDGWIRHPCEKFFERCVPAALHLAFYEPLDELRRQYAEWNPTRHGQVVSGAAKSLAYLWRQEYGSALSAASGLGDVEPVTAWQHVLAAIRFESAHHIGRRKKAGVLPPNTDYYLRTLGFDWLADAVAERINKETIRTGR